jgi:TDG/mug DNA glycosylase family protein
MAVNGEGTSLARGDVLAPRLRVVFVGLNPAVTAEKSGHNFSAPSNRFWRALHLSGFTPELLAAADERQMLEFGIGLTALVTRATVGASEVTPAEFRAAAPAFSARIERYAPKMVAFLGKAGFAALAARAVDWGAQPEVLGGAGVWVLPNPSGLNRAFGLDALAAAYRELREAVSGQQGRQAG